MTEFANFIGCDPNGLISAAIPTFSPVNRFEALNTPAQQFRLGNYCPIEVNCRKVAHSGAREEKFPAPEAP